MRLTDMHVYFRQYAQQMGMQNTRAILPEQIDICINTASRDIVLGIISENVNKTGERNSAVTPKPSEINNLRTLWRNNEVSLMDTTTISDYSNNGYQVEIDVAEEEILYFVNFSINYFNITDINYVINRATLSQAVKAAQQALNNLPSDATEEQIAEATQALQEAQAAYNENEEAISDAINVTRWFPIRLVEDAYFADVLNDAILSPSMNKPMMVSNGEISNTGLFSLYFGENKKVPYGSIASKHYINAIRYSYIKVPRTVRYAADISGATTVESDLPEQLHIPMLKLAVELYLKSKRDATQTNQVANVQ